MKRTSVPVPVSGPSPRERRAPSCLRREAVWVAGDVVDVAMSGHLVAVVAHQQLLQRRRVGHQGAHSQPGKGPHNLVDAVTVDLEADPSCRNPCTPS